MLFTDWLNSLSISNFTPNTKQNKMENLASGQHNRRYYDNWYNEKKILNGQWSG